jgi:hypothetical protein
MATPAMCPPELNHHFAMRRRDAYQSSVYSGSFGVVILSEITGSRSEAVM